MAFCGGWIDDVFSHDFKYHLVSVGLNFIPFKDSIDWIHRDRDQGVTRLFPLACRVRKNSPSLSRE